MIETQDPVSLIRIRYQTSGLNRFFSRLIIVLWLIQLAIPASYGITNTQIPRLATTRTPIVGATQWVAPTMGAGVGLPVLFAITLFAATREASATIRYVGA